MSHNSLELSPLSNYPSAGVSDVLSNILQEEVYARSFNLSQLKSELLEFLTALTEHEGKVR